MEQRVFYKPVMVSGKQFQIYIPKNVADALEIKGRDEVEIVIKKTGRVIPISRTSNFGRKEANGSEQGQ